MNSGKSTVIDVGSWAATLTRSWWAIAGLIVIGVLVAAVVTLVQPNRYTATASVYIGQTTDANGSPMAGLNSNARAAIQLLNSQTVLEEAAARVGTGVSAARLRRGTTVETPSSTVRTTTSVVNIIVINITDTDKQRAAAAANAMAEVLLERLESGVGEKIDLLERQLAESQKQRSAAAARGVAAEKAVAAIANGNGSAAEKAAASAAWVAVSQAAATEQQALTPSIQKTQLQLLTARQVEQPRILHEAAVPDAPSSPSLMVNLAVGALAGLVIGVIVAFARRGLAERRAAEAAQD